MSFPATMSIGTVNIRKLDIYVSSEHSNTTTIAWDIFSIPSKDTQKTRKKHPFEQSRYRKENKNLMFEFF